VVLAAGAWTETLLPSGEPRLGIRPVRGEMVVFSGAAGTRLPILTRGETYLVPRADGTVLAGSTVVEAGFDREVPAASVTDIVARARDLYPPARSWTVQEAWSGLRPRGGDPYPIVGPSVHPGLWISTGHFRNGILLAFETATWIASMVAGESVPEAAPFSPGRFVHRADTKTASGNRTP
jgi:glycine oxidase